MKPKIIFHCGAPKTGSTSFQHLLYANREALLKAGIHFPEVSRKKRVADDLRILLSRLSLKPGKAQDKQIRKARKVIEQTLAENKAHTLLVSHESILGAPFGTGKKSIYPKAARKVPAIAKALEGYDVEVRFFVRDYAGFIPSWYVQQVRMGRTQTFEDFCKRHHATSFSFLPLIAILRASFGEDRVQVFDHADLVADSHATLSKSFPEIMAALGEAGRVLPRKNRTIGGGMVAAYRRWNRMTARLPGSRKVREGIRHFGRRYVLLPLERFSNSPKIAFEPSIAKSLSERFRAELPGMLGSGPG